MCLHTEHFGFLIFSPEVTLRCQVTVVDRRLDVAQTSSEYVLQQRHLLRYESEPIP